MPRLLREVRDLIGERMLRRRDDQARRFAADERRFRGKKIAFPRLPDLTEFKNYYYLFTEYNGIGSGRAGPPPLCSSRACHRRAHFCHGLSRGFCGNLVETLAIISSSAAGLAVCAGR
jgi:hypothetical protein